MEHSDAVTMGPGHSEEKPAETRGDKSVIAPEPHQEDSSPDAPAQAQPDTVVHQLSGRSTDVFISGVSQVTQSQHPAYVTQIS